jgi:hypothetical protein
MNRLVFLAVGLLLGFTLLSPRSGHAETLLIGELSFDDIGTGDAFDLSNFTDGLSPTDGIADDDLFSGSLSVNIQGMGNTVYVFSGIDSLLTGAVSPTIVVLPYSDGVLSATLSLTLGSSTAVNILNSAGNPAVANLSAVPNTQISPSVGTTLTPCDLAGDPCSLSLIDVNTVSPTTSITPEPGTLWLAASGIGSMAAIGRKRRRHA